MEVVVEDMGRMNSPTSKKAVRLRLESWDQQCLRGKREKAIREVNETKIDKEIKD